MVHRRWLVVPDVIWHIYFNLDCSKGDGDRKLMSSGEQPLPCEFWTDWPRFSFFRGRWVKGPSSLALLRMCLNNGQWLLLWFGTFTHAWPAPQRIVLRTYNLQGRWSLVRGRSPVSFKQIGPGSVSGEFEPRGWAAQLPQIHNGGAQPTAPDVIWHIYLHLCCSSKYGGRDLPSSGEAAPTMGKVPCEFWAGQPGFSFSGEDLRQGSFQLCPSKDGASSLAGGSGPDLAYLLTNVLLLEGWW